MSVIRAVASLVVVIFLGGHCVVSAEPLTPEQFKQELVGVPLCGIPPTGPVAGKWLCTVHLPDGTAVAAGSGLLVRGVWEIDGDRVCRRNPQDPMERRRCVEYERL